MFLRTTQRRNRDGSLVRYLQLAHSERTPGSAVPRPRVLYSFGREDQVDRQAIRRLISSLSRVLDPAEAAALQAPADLRFLESRPMGGAYVLEGIWKRLGVDALLGRLLKKQHAHPRTERAIFAMVANRALEPSSKLACTAWVQERVAIPGLEELDDDTCYRSMDRLLELEAPITEAVYWQVADLLNRDVDLLFFDTTSTYFETDEADAPSEEAMEADPKAKGFRTYNKHSKDHRPDLPQIVVGLAVTREGIPVRVWSWPGNTNDSALIRQVKDDLREWKLGRVVWVADRGFSSSENRRYLQRDEDHYILGERMRDRSPEAQAALARPGRYHTVADNLEVKEVVIGGGTRDRFVICRNPEEIVRDKRVRENLLRQLEEAIADSDRLPADKRSELVGRLKTKPGLARYLHVDPEGFLRIDRAKVAREERLDGKFLLRTSDPSLSAEDVALGYKQLLQVERAWRDMKTTLDLRPIHHRKEERIRAHVLLCWLSLLLIRIVENQTRDTWRNIRNELERMHLITCTGPAGVVRKRTEVTRRQNELLAALKLKAPPLIAQLDGASSSAA